MYGSRLASGLTAVFAGTALLFAVLGVVANLFFFLVAALFGTVAYLTWYHASGKLADRVYRGVERQAATTDGGQGGGGGFGAGPREEWVPPRDGGPAGAGGRRQQRERAGAAGRRRVGDARNPQRGPRPADYRILGLEPDADEGAVREAYREKVKEVHPDTDGGDEERFKRVNAAYERLTGEAA